MRLRTRLSPLLLSCSMLFGAVATAGADTLVVPSAQTNAEGNSANAFPFGKAPASSNPIRYQQVYAASEFAAIEGGLTITELRFRLDSSNTSVSASQFDGIEVRLSTTAKSPDGLDVADFDANVGADDTQVFLGAFTWPACPNASGCPSSPPQPFDQAIVLTQPFFYDPTQGNLLLEVYNDDPTIVIGYFLDQQFAPSDSVSRVVETDNATQPRTANTGGLVTQFVYTVPEAGSLASATAALLAVAALRRRA